MPPSVTPSMFPDVESVVVTPPPGPPVAEGVPFAAGLLALSAVPGLGVKAARALVARFGDRIGALTAGGAGELARVLSEARIPNAGRLEEAVLGGWAEWLRAGIQEVTRLAGEGGHLFGPADIPERLRTIPDAPLWLFVHGDPRVLRRRPVVAVVGTREPTEAGVRAAERVARLLAPYPVVVASGLAEGIDEAAHRASLDCGLPNVAFLGHGSDTVFPRETAALRTRIVRSGGAVVSEYFPSEPIQKRYFVERNRLQAGLADVVIPVEAAVTSGTAHTVRFARDYGRRLVGIYWKGAEGIVRELERDGREVVDINSQTGCRALDRIIQDEVERSGGEPYPLAGVERNILLETQSRHVSQAHLRRLIRRLEATAEGLSNGGTAQGRDP